MKSAAAKPPLSTFSATSTQPSAPNLISSFKTSSCVVSSNWNLLILPTASSETPSGSGSGWSTGTAGVCVRTTWSTAMKLV
jgi:hypothetical protein